MRSSTDKKQKKQYESSATVVDGTLILTLPDARTPTVWRMGLEKASAAAFQVRDQADENGYTLTMSTPDKQDYSIASFNERDAAVKALLAASRAMAFTSHDAPDEYSAPHSRSSSASVAQSLQAQKIKHSRRGRGLMTAAGIILIVILLYMIANTGPQRIAPDDYNANARGKAADNGNQRSMSAEQFLQQQ